MLFVDLSSTFNKVPSHKLLQKPSNLGLGSSLCTCILDFFSNQRAYLLHSPPLSWTLVHSRDVPLSSTFSAFSHTSELFSICISNTIIQCVDKQRTLPSLLTFWRTSPGPCTSLTKIKDCAYSRCSGKLTYPDPCWQTSTAPPLRAFWPAAVLCGSAAALQRRGRTCSRWREQH